VAAFDPKLPLASTWGLRLLIASCHAPFIRMCYKRSSPEIATERPVTERHFSALARGRRIMEKAHWLSRKRASLKLAQDAASAEARLVHYDLAGRYSLKALSAETLAIDLADSLSPPILPNRRSGTLRCSDNG
jgi:hypothetical protein